MFVTGEIGIARKVFALVRLMKIQTNAYLIVVVCSDYSRRIDRGRNIACRIEIRDIYSDRIEACRGELIIRIRHTACRKVDERISET